MKVKLLFSYFENIIPKGCRKSRMVRFDDGEVIVEIKELKSDDAPVAIRSKGRSTLKMSNPFISEFVVEYRWWANQLWTSVEMDGVEPRRRIYGTDQLSWPSFLDVIDTRSNFAKLDYRAYALSGNTYGMSQLEVCDLLHLWSDEHILIDDIAYRKSGEPRYVVMTFGLGCNHGGTSCLMSDSYNSNIMPETYFNIMERDKAIALATRIATDRGDTKSLPMTASGPEWEVLIPEAITANFSKVNCEELIQTDGVDLIKDTFGKLYHSEIDSDQAEKLLANILTKEKLAEYLVDAFNRGWITPLNVGFDLSED